MLICAKSQPALCGESEDEIGRNEGAGYYDSIRIFTTAI